MGIVDIYRWYIKIRGWMGFFGGECRYRSGYNLSFGFFDMSYSKEGKKF